MDQGILRQYLYDHIPLSQAMQVEVLSAQPDGVLLTAPLPPNINHQETIFGGSASAVAILAAWSLLHVRLQHEGISSRLLIQSNTMQYELPIAGSFTARSCLAPDADWPRFVRTLARKGRARIAVSSVLEFQGQQAGKLHGEFVALAPEIP
ncbi:thioesterase [Herminiimonas sp. KBW02]|uniref:YiiD C-terminal domain-containing protein n=1 Tax=Herminiimonas sp. KBW02 TaxID=2153363 RepID=UPI000F5B13DB|nr:YiiD C-terminal domain-containing protein [Herminiimonas sp. KBW02]RQO37467.1 thioesterase [Herminiimonas sp. KBW02]